MPSEGDRAYQTGLGAPSRSKYPSLSAPRAARVWLRGFAVCLLVLRAIAVRMPQPPVAPLSYRCSVSVIQAGIDRVSALNSSKASEVNFSRMVFMVRGLTCSLPRYQSADRARPEGRPDKASFRGATCLRMSRRLPSLISLFRPLV